MSDNSDLVRLQGFDRQIGEIEMCVGDLFTHLDSTVSGEKKGNPQYSYDRPGYISNYVHRLVDMEGQFESESPLGKILEGRRKASIQKLVAISRIGTSDFTGAAERYYRNAVPSKEDVMTAVEVIGRTESSVDCDTLCVNAEGLGERMTEYLARKGVSGKRLWKVTVESPGPMERMPALSLNKTTKTVRIRDDYVKPERKAETSVLHEGSHIMQWENGLRQPLPNTFYHGTDGRSVATQEGLASIITEKEGFPGNMRKYAAYVIAVDSALKGATYMDIFQSMQKDYRFSEKDAKEIAHRVKRGLSDTSQPGGFVKDAVYMLGRWRIHDHVGRHGESNEQETLKDFYIGNVAVEDMDSAYKWLLRDGIIRPAGYLPDCLEKKD